MDRKAVIDIGSNSVKLFIGEKNENDDIKTVLDKNDIARLGDGLQKTGIIGADAMKRNVDAVLSFYKSACEYTCSSITAVGTMALRNAKNSSEFINKVKSACGIEVKILPGEEEARLSYLAVLSGLPLKDEDILIFDTGGGSTEFIFGHGRKLIKRFSINLGAVRIYEDYLLSDPVKDDEIKNALLQIDKELLSAGIKNMNCHLIGIGGTVSSMSAVKHKLNIYDPDIVHGSALTREDILNEIKEFSSKTIEERKKIPGVPAKRADVILAGALILEAITRNLGISSITVSDRGLRHGLVFEQFNKDPGTP